MVTKCGVVGGLISIRLDGVGMVGVLIPSVNFGKRVNKNREIVIRTLAPQLDNTCDMGFRVGINRPTQGRWE